MRFLELQKCYKIVSGDGHTVRCAIHSCSVVSDPCSPPGCSVHGDSPGMYLVKVKDAQSCQTLCNPMDYRVHGILQARILEWVPFLFSRGSSQSRDRTQISCIAGRFFTSWATREAPRYISMYLLRIGKKKPICSLNMDKYYGMSVISQ